MLDKLTVAKVVMEKTKKLKSVTLKYTAQSMDIGHNGLLMENAVSPATKEHNTEPELVSERNMAAKTVSENPNSLEFATPKYIAQSTDIGLNGPLMESAVLLAKREHTTEQELVLERNMAAKTVSEIPNNLEFVTLKYTAQSTDIGLNGQHMDNVAKPVAKEPNTERELASEEHMEAKTVLEMTNNLQFATPERNAQNMDTGPTGLNTATAVPIVVKEPNSEQESVKVENMVEMTAKENPKNLEFVKARNTVQLMANGHNGLLMVNVASLVAREHK